MNEKHLEQSLQNLDTPCLQGSNEEWMGVVGGHRVVSICDVKNGIFKEQRDAARLNMYHMEKFRSTPIAILPVVLVSVFNFLSHFGNGPSLLLQIGFACKGFPLFYGAFLDKISCYSYAKCLELLLSLSLVKYLMIYSCW